MKTYKEFISESLRDKMVGKDMKEIVLSFINKDYEKETGKWFGKQHALQMIERGDSYDDIYNYCLKYYK